MSEHLSLFSQHRPRLFGIAYRMLSSRAEAEDIVQTAFLRWYALSENEIRAIQNSQAWLVTVLSRLCIDRLRVLKTERENYIGPWLPEPLIDADHRTPEWHSELSSDVSMAFLMLLERLSAEERLAFLLHQVFEFNYQELAETLNKNAAACRQLIHRAKLRLQQERPRFTVSREQHQAVLQQFMLAAQSGELGALQTLLADDARMIGDGGGKAISVNRMLTGSLRIARLYHVTARQFAGRMEFAEVWINGEPGLLRYIDGKLDASLSFVTDGEKILDIYTVRNPDKLILS